MSEIPLNILQTLRERQGLEPDDESQDDQFENLSPIEKFQEWCGWEFGDSAWAEQLVEIMEDCGFDVTRQGTEVPDEQEP